jgi:hypothetical protein
VFRESGTEQAENQQAERGGFRSPRRQADIVEDRTPPLPPLAVKVSTTVSGIVTLMRWSVTTPVVVSFTGIVIASSKRKLRDPTGPRVTATVLGPRLGIEAQEVADPRF